MATLAHRSVGEERAFARGCVRHSRRRRGCSARWAWPLHELIPFTTFPFTLREAHVVARVAVGELGVLQAEQVEHVGVPVVDIDGVDDALVAELVGLSETEPGMIILLGLHGGGLGFAAFIFTASSRCRACPRFGG